MLRISSLLAVGTLLLGIGSVSAGAPTNPGSQVAGSAIVNVAQYDGGRCFNRCVSGWVFRGCQNDSEAKRENCCNLACNRVNNWHWNY
jgi:hypothetical protein